jgi:transcriptional regulator with XRE-family HTH domain
LRRGTVKSARHLHGTALEKEVSLLKNPFTRIREDSGLSGSAFAAALGVSVQSLQQAQNGTLKSPAKILQSLARLGFDADALAEEHAVWMKSHVEEAGRRLRQSS